MKRVSSLEKNLSTNHDNNKAQIGHPCQGQTEIKIKKKLNNWIKENHWVRCPAISYPEKNITIMSSTRSRSRLLNWLYKKSIALAIFNELSFILIHILTLILFKLVIRHLYMYLIPTCLFIFLYYKFILSIQKI